MIKEYKQLTYQQFDKQEDKLKEKGWKITEVKQDDKIVLLERILLNDEESGIINELQKWLNTNVAKKYQKTILRLTIELI